MPELMNLSKNLSETDFTQNYWLKEELIHFCKEIGLKSSGSKEVISNTILEYLKTGVIKSAVSVPRKSILNTPSVLELESLIPQNYTNDETHREFFRNQIGLHFKFNVQFMNWMKENRGKKRYSDAVIEWNRLLNEKNDGIQYEIGTQFKYNAYTRAFFADNPGKSKSDCIKCWNYKKTRPGQHAYEKDDLRILESGAWGI